MNREIQEKAIIREEIEKTKKGQHKCPGGCGIECLMGIITPIILNIKTEEAMAALVDIVYFCNDQLERLKGGCKYISLKDGLSWILEEKTKEDDPRKRWEVLERETGKDQVSITALYILLYFIEVIFETWAVKNNIKKNTIN